MVLPRKLCLHVEGAVPCRLQTRGLLSSLATTVVLFVASFYDVMREEYRNAPSGRGSLHWSPRPSYLMAIAQCVNTLVNVVGVLLLSKAYELFGSPKPPALSWLRPIRLCNCGRARRPVPGSASDFASAWKAKTEELAGRGISLGNLMDFYSQLFESERMSFQPPVHTTKDVVRLEIIPRTSAVGQSFSELVNGGKKVAVVQKRYQVVIVLFIYCMHKYVYIYTYRSSCHTF